MSAVAGRGALRILRLPPFPRANSAAGVLGRYRNCETAAMTLAAVLPDTLLEPLVTRDTVAIETPASLATSHMVHGTSLGPARAFPSSFPTLKERSDSRPGCRPSNEDIRCSLLVLRISKGLAPIVVD